MIGRKLISLLIFGTFSALVWAQTSTTRADQQLEDLLKVQRELLIRAEAAQTQEDVETLRPRLQDLVFDWEEYLRTYENKPEGYIAYSMLLGNPLIDERKRAKALLLKANTLDPNLPIVKNQLGKYLAEEGLPRQALPYFIAAADLAPEEPLYHYQIGQLLAGARDSFLASGEWTTETIDKAMQDALAEAVRLDPDSIAFAYRYAESFYDLESPPWEDAIAAWQELEARSESMVEQQMMRLHQANVRLFQGQLEAAEALLDESFDEVLVGQQENLLARLDRLRNPPEPAEPSIAEIARTTTPAGPVDRVTTPPEDLAPIEIPGFTPARAPEPVPLSSRGVVELSEDATIGEVTGTRVESRTSESEDND
ncbi:MAG: hypothetical protein SynsKO_14210 [Synoicihabitans sp.]